MRDIFLTAIILGGVPIILLRPYIGTLLWIWLSLMTPHRFTWGFAYDFSFVELIAIVTLASLIFSPDRKSFPITKTTVFFVLFTLWVMVTTLTAITPAFAWPRLEFVLKLFALAYVAFVTINTRERIHVCVWMVVISIVFYGIKGGVFAILSGGSFIVYGPPGSFLSANNSVGLAMVMVFPLIIYLYLNSSRTWIRWGLAGAGILSIFCVLATFSRGALVGLLIMVLYLTLKMRRKFLYVSTALFLGVISFAFMPENWHERVASIADYEVDSSVQGRFEVWGFAWEMALDRPVFGGGFDVFRSGQAYSMYAPEITGREAHSIIFQVLGEHGFVGLFLFLMILLSAGFNSGWVRRQTRGRLDLRWAYDLASMLQVCLVGYVGAGLFLNKAFFDLIYVIIAIMVATGVTVAKAIAADATVSDVDPVPVSGLGSIATRFQRKSAD